jgi:two-component system sensor histidine kinase BaeS
VSDTGIGIEDAAVPHVFDRFWRADKVRSRAEGGAGLGLSLASQIVQRHGGTISVASELGRGTSFTVRLQAAVVSPIS